MAITGRMTADELRAKFARAGFATEDFAAPIYIDVIDETPRRWTVAAVPEMQKAMTTLGVGGQMVVATLAHFAPVALWAWALPRLIQRRATLHDLDSRETYDLQSTDNCELLQKTVERVANRLKGDALRLGRIKSGRLGAHERLEDPAMKRRAKRLWEDATLSAAQVSAKTTISVATLYRHFGAKSEAEAAAGAKVAAKAAPKKPRA